MASKKPRGNPSLRVNLCLHAPRCYRGKDESTGRANAVGGRRKLWAFGYADLGALLGLGHRAIGLAIEQGRLDPRDLASIASFWLSRRKP
jgi:hypothetical protein